MQSSSKIILLLATLAIVQVASSLPSGLHGGVARNAQHTAREMEDVVYAVQNAVHRNLQQKMVPLTEQEEDEINEAVKKSVEQSISQNASPAEIGERVKQVVADILAVKQNLPLGREINFWTALEEAALEAVQENLVSIEQFIDDVPEYTVLNTDRDDGMSALEKEHVARKSEHSFEEIIDVVRDVQIAVHRNLQQKRVLLSEQEEDEINEAIEGSVAQSITQNASPAEIAEKVKQVVGDIIVIKHDMPFGRENAFWSSLERDAEEAARDNLIDESGDDVPQYTVQNTDRDGGMSALPIEPVVTKVDDTAQEISDVVHVVKNAVHHNLQQKMIPLTEQEEDEIDNAIRSSIKQEISRNGSPAEIAKHVK